MYLAGIAVRWETTTLTRQLTAKNITINHEGGGRGSGEIYGSGEGERTRAAGRGGGRQSQSMIAVVDVVVVLFGAIDSTAPPLSS